MIGVQNADLALLPGMTANLEIVTQERDNALRVPNAALRFRPTVESTSAASPARSGPAAGPGIAGRVYIPDHEQTPQAVALRTGITDRTYTEVVAGDLVEGAPVIVAGGPRALSVGEATATRPRLPRL